MPQGMRSSIVITSGLPLMYDTMATMPSLLSSCVRNIFLTRSGFVANEASAAIK